MIYSTFRPFTRKRFHAELWVPCTFYVYTHVRAHVRTCTRTRAAMCALAHDQERDIARARAQLSCRAVITLFLWKMPPKKNGKEFQWTDDEADLLLNVTYEYKVKKSAESVDWESVRSKYDDIFTLMQEHLPDTVEEEGGNGKDYPHSKQDLTKAIVSTKLKNIRLKFRQAVDGGDHLLQHRLREGWRPLIWTPL